jgi:hypothetical protein
MNPPGQAEQFNRFGCGCRCLMRLRELREMPILSREDFIESFVELFKAAWSKRCGVTNTSALIDIGRKLDLCDFADTISYLPKAKRMLEADAYSGALLLTHRSIDRETGAISERDHCRLYLSHEGSRWHFFSPLIDGTDEDEFLDEMDLMKISGHFLFFYRLRR